VGIGRAHSRPVGEGVALDGYVLERPISVVAIESFSAEVIDHVKVRITVVIEVSPHRPETQAFVADACPLRYVGKCAVAVVVIKLVRLSVAGVEGGGNNRARIQVPADIQVKKPIVVVVRPGGYGGDRVLSQA